MRDLFDALSMIVAKRFAEAQSTRRDPAEDVTDLRTRPERNARRVEAALMAARLTRTVVDPDA